MIGLSRDSVEQYQKTQLLVFEYASKTFAVPLHDVEEIIEPENIEEYPGSTAHCRGTINHRDRIIPIFDAHGLGFEKDQPDALSPYLIILNVEGVTFGLTQERHLELAEFEIQIEETPKSDGPIYTRGMMTYREKAMNLLSPARIASLVRKNFNNKVYEVYRGEAPKSENSANIQKFIVSQIGEMTIAHPICTVLEIIEGLDIMPIFSVNASLRGLTSLRGRVLACIDVSDVLGLEPRVLDDRSAFLVLCFKEFEFALSVDKVLGIKNLSSEHFQPTDGLLPANVHQIFDAVSEEFGTTYLRLMPANIVHWDRIAAYCSKSAD